MTAVAICLGMAGAASAAEAELSGQVRDENEAPVAGAHITLRPAVPQAGVRIWQAQTDPAGAFTLTVPAPGDYLVDVEREGYYRLKDRAVHVEGSQEMRLVINNVREVFQSVDVSEQSSPVDLAQTRHQERLSGTAINNIVYPNSHSLRSAMGLMPGVLQDARGTLHFNGSSEDQVQYGLNGFNITDHLTGQFQTTLATEGIRALEFVSGRYSPEFGKGSAGVLAIRTENGSDAFHYTATNFIPGINIQQGVRMGNWYPRFGVSGPIRRGRAWFSDTFDSEYSNALITGLPRGQNIRSGWTGSNLLHTQINVTPRNILYADFLVNISNRGRVGLGPLDPVSTTQKVRAQEYFGSVKDQFYPGGRSLIEFGYAHNEFSRVQTPQGDEIYVFSPEGRSGNYFVTSDQKSSRDQVLVHGYAPPLSLAGTHQFEAGADADFLHYTGDIHRTGYDLLGVSGQLLAQTVFFGPGAFRVHDTEVSSWVLDTWRISKRFQVDAGIRQDWDRRVSDFGWSPRIAFSWAPFAEGRTRVAGGYSVTRDAVSLDPFGRALDQAARTTEYGAGGVPAGAPVLTTFGIGSARLKLPRATNWSLSGDRQIAGHLFGSVKYLRRRGTEGFSFVNTLAPEGAPSLLPLPNGASGGRYQLANLRRDEYDSVQLSLRQSLSGQYEWMASYTWSRAHSNAVFDVNSAVPLQVLPDGVPMPWDAPQRLLAWAYLPLPPRLVRSKNWSLATLVDARTGFPFSVLQPSGVVSGGVDARRFPFHFDLNLAIERMITLRGYRFALRAGADNLTNRKNPSAVNNVIGAPQFLTYFGEEGRHFVVRIRFFGRAGKK
ncbi:MAG: TonB-dependent receptor [Acidobacteriota bacterium]